MDVSYPVINICPAYFNTRDFAKAVEDNKNVKITEKFNLEYYQSNIGMPAP